MTPAKPPSDEEHVQRWRTDLFSKYGALRAAAPHDADVASLLAQVRAEASQEVAIAEGDKEVAARHYQAMLDERNDLIEDLRSQKRAAEKASQEKDAEISRAIDEIAILRRKIKDSKRPAFAILQERDNWRQRAVEAEADLRAEKEVNLPTTHAMNLAEELRKTEAERDALREENARLKEAAIIAGTTQANLHDVIRERDKENARLREEAALFSAQATIERLKARGNELGRDYEQKVWEVMAEIGKREAAEADAEEARAIVRDFFPKEGGEGLRALVLRTINERDALREENARLRDALKQTTEHLSVGIQESQADYQSPPEPSSQWDADAVTHVVANRALLAEPAPEKAPAPDLVGELRALAKVTEELLDDYMLFLGDGVTAENESDLVTRVRAALARAKEQGR